MNTAEEFAPLLAGLRSLTNRGPGALATLIQTRGPTFRRAGARMLVFADGSILRGLSAGCPEQDIIRHGLEAIRERTARIVRYDPLNGYDTLVEMGCGGEMEVLVEPLKEPQDWAFAEAIQNLMQQRRSGWVASWYASDDRCLPSPQRLVFAEDRPEPTLDQPESSAILDAVRAVIEQGSIAGTHTVRVETGSGVASILIERLRPPRAAYLFGANSASLALARLLIGLGWDTAIVVPHPKPLDLPTGCRLHVCPAERLQEQLHPDAHSFVMVMTLNLESDLAYLKALAERRVGYLGALGARRRAMVVKQRLGTTATPLHSPAGLDLGSETPEEIAISVAAEMLAVAQGMSGQRLSATESPIHR